MNTLEAVHKLAFIKEAPFRSRSQRRLFWAMHRRGEMPLSTIKHWEKATKDKAELPERVSKSAAAPMGRGMRMQAPSAGGRGRKGGPFAAGPGGTCVCPSCGTTSPHAIGTPCSNKKCPKCGTLMTRKVPRRR